MAIRFEINDQEVIDQIRGAVRKLEKPDAMLGAIGDVLLHSTKQRFTTSTAPDGSRWLANARSTIEQFLNKKKSSNFGKRGKITARGQERAISKRPLIGETGLLSSIIHWQIEDGGHSLVVGSPFRYAAVQQLGAKKGQFAPHVPWGDIPARPYLGLSNDDIEAIGGIVKEFLEKESPSP